MTTDNHNFNFVIYKVENRIARITLNNPEKRNALSFPMRDEFVQALKLAESDDSVSLVLIDGAQATPHTSVDVQALNCDFYCFSAHKMYGPTGVGVLYGRKEILEKMPPYHGGGEMIKEVKFEGSTYNDLPFKFEAGTPNIAQVIGLGEAILYLSSIGMNQISEYKKKLTQFALDKLLLLIT